MSELFTADAMEIGRRIRVRRVQLGLTQKALAELVYCTTQAVSKWEVGASTPSLTTLGYLALVLQTSSDYILGLAAEVTAEASNVKYSLDQEDGRGGSPSSSVRKHLSYMVPVCAETDETLMQPLHGGTQAA